MNHINNFIKTTCNSAFNAGVLGAIGYSCIHVLDNTSKVVIASINGSKFAWYTKLALQTPAGVGAVGSGLTCALCVVVDTIVKRVFDELNKLKILSYLDIDLDNPQAIMARKVISIGLTASAATFLGLTGSVAVAAAVIIGSMAVNALALHIFSTLDYAWYKINF